MQSATTQFVRRPSAVHGDGVFTTQPIAAGAAVFEFGGPVVSSAQVREDMRALQIGPDQYIVEDTEADYIENYINHRCEPNLGFTHGSLTLRALRDIAAGEELFWDYSTAMSEPGWWLPCACGVKSCRGKIESFCDMPSEEQHRLRPISLAYLRV